MPQKNPLEPEHVGFLSLGGRMGALIRDHDWAQTSLGPIETWPSTLRTTLQLVLASPFPMVLIWGRDLLAFHNDAYQPLLGNKPDALGRLVLDVWEETREVVGPLIERAYAGEPCRYENAPFTLLREHTAEEAYFDFSFSPVQDETGAVVAVLHVVIETSARVAAEQSAAKERERQRHILQQMPGFVAVLSSPEHRFDYVNDAYRKIGGNRQFIGRTVREVFPELEGQAFYDLLDRVYETGEAFTGRAMPVRLAGTNGERFIDLLYEPIRNDAGRVTGIFVGGYDVTEQVRVAERLRDSEARLRQFNETLESQVTERTNERDRMWNSSPELMAVVDFEGVLRRVNPAWTTVLGYAPEELVGVHVNTLVLPDDQASTTDAYRLAAQGGQPRIRNRYRHKDGSSRWISWVAAPYGELTYATGRDVTLEHQQQVELERAQDALRQSQKMDAVGQLTGGLAHDFNNLLAAISGSLEMMQSRIEQGRASEVGRYLDGAQEAARRAAALTHRLLAFSRRQTLDPKPTDLNRLVGRMEDLIRRTVGPQITVEVVRTSNLWPTLVDPNQLENALLNLCINARDAMPKGGTMVVETGNCSMDGEAARERDLAPGDYVTLCVSDTGSGMTEEVMEKAFDPFFTTKPIGLGTGLGLSMIHGFVHQSGGHVAIHSETGQGTTVCLLLPRHHTGETVLAPAKETSGASTVRGRSILVVDDEPLVRMLLVDVIEDLGHTALEAGDGPRALDILQSEAHIDLLVTDVGLPNGMNGRQVADAARELRGNLNVLFVTGYAENTVLGYGDLAPGMQVVTKPFDINALSDRIRQMLES